ncbi:hypothetical protein Tco_0151055 [Tanacetum coccineum]
MDQKMLNMRHMRWIELLSDYDCGLKYHPGKANVVVDALSRKERLRPSRVLALGMIVQTSLKSSILKAHNEALREENLEADKLYNAIQKFKIWSNGVRCFKERSWNLKINNLREVILKQMKPLEFQIGDKVLLKVSPWKGMICFRKQGKMNPGYVGPFTILESVGLIACRLELPQELRRIDDVFHVSNLKKCLTDKTLVVSMEEIWITDKLQFI